MTPKPRLVFLLFLLVVAISAASLVIQQKSGIAVSFLNSKAARPDYEYTPFITVANVTNPSRFPTVGSGDVLKYTVRGRPNSTFSYCYSNYGCNSGSSFTTNSQGVWTVSGTAYSTATITRTHWVVINGITSNKVTFTIQKPVKATF